MNEMRPTPPPPAASNRFFFLSFAAAASAGRSMVVLVLSLLSPSSFSSCCCLCGMSVVRGVLACEEASSPSSQHLASNGPSRGGNKKRAAGQACVAQHHLTASTCFV